MYATALVIIIFLLDLIAGGRLRSLVRLGASDVYVSLIEMGDKVFGSGLFSTREQLEKENSQLKAELVAYQQKDTAYSSVQDENAHLRALVGLASRMPGRTASITSSLYASAYGTFTVDVGIEDGVSRGSVVFTPDGYAIGVISETSSHSSLVSELFAPDVSTEAVVGTTHVVLEGQGGGNARAHVPRESSIATGDVVRAPSVDAPVGLVEHVESNPNGADKEIYVRVPSNLQTLMLVYVGRK